MDVFDVRLAQVMTGGLIQVKTGGHRSRHIDAIAAR